MADSAQRRTRLTIDLGGEPVELVRLEASEGLSQPFHFEIELLSPESEIDLLPHLGKPVAVAVYDDDTLLRHFHGIAVDGVFLRETKGEGFGYRLTIRPRAFLHEQGKDYRIFQDKSAKAILEDVFQKCGIKASFDKLEGGTRTRKYCVQYGESDFGFASRLMEEEGIYYFYKHSAGDHELVLCDSPHAHATGDASPLHYNPLAGSVGRIDTQSRTSGAHKLFVSSWQERVSTGAEAKVTLRDFDFTRPGRPLQVEASEEGAHPEDRVEIFGYPGHYFQEAAGNDYSKAILQARRANRQVYSGESGASGIVCGARFKLQDHSIGRFNAEFLVTQTFHSFGSEAYRSGMGDGMDLVRFEAVPAETRWRAPLTSRRPVVAGPETAIVTGPAGETIHTDKYGRVKVQFHWDREGHNDDHSSCWIRVSQTGGLGNVILPRVGHEVLVDFINGDPDRPIVVGRVFNETHMPIYPLPANRTRAVWRTLSAYGAPKSYGEAKTLDVARTSCNEIRFEDKGGEEEIFVQAERDMNAVVAHDESLSVGRNESIMIGYDRTKNIGHDETTTVGRDQHGDVGRDRSHNIGRDDALSVGRDKADTIAHDLTWKVGHNFTAKADNNIVIEAGKKLTLKVGGSTIVMDEKSITIKTTKLAMTGSAQMSLKSSGEGTVDGGGTLTVKGGMVSIN